MDNNFVIDLEYKTRAVMATEHYDSCGKDDVSGDGKSRWGVTENWKEEQ